MLPPRWNSDPEDETREFSRRQKLWALAESPFVLWVLSTVVVGLFGWGYARVESGLSHSKAKSALVQRADAEAKSRLEQWVGMSRVRWARKRFSWKFPDFYSRLINSPESHPTRADAIYPAYREFANSALIAVLVQLRDNVPVEQMQDINAAISWVGVWNPDIWTDKSFRQAVTTVIEHLWLSRWGNRPTIPEVVLFNIIAGGGLIDPQLTLLSAVHPNDNSRNDKNGLFVFSADDGSGRQRWEIEQDSGNFWRIRVASGIVGDGDFLSSKIDGESVDLYNVDDKSGRQRWVLENAGNDFKHIIVYEGVSGGSRYLSTSPDGSYLSLAKADDGSGRQRWKIQRVE